LEDISAGKKLPRLAVKESRIVRINIRHELPTPWPSQVSMEAGSASDVLLMDKDTQCLLLHGHGRLNRSNFMEEKTHPRTRQRMLWLNVRYPMRLASIILFHLLSCRRKRVTLQALRVKNLGKSHLGRKEKKIGGARPLLESRRLYWRNQQSYFLVINASNQIESRQINMKKRTYAVAAAHGMEFSALRIHIYSPKIQQPSIRYIGGPTCLHRASEPASTTLLGRPRLPSRTLLIRGLACRGPNIADSIHSGVRRSWIRRINYVFFISHVS
jgi:hypothetical protein